MEIRCGGCSAVCSTKIPQKCPLHMCIATEFLFIYWNVALHLCIYYFPSSFRDTPQIKVFEALHVILSFVSWHSLLLYILTTSLSAKIHHPPTTCHIIFTSPTGWGPEKGHFWNLNCCWLGTVLFSPSAFHSCCWPNSSRCSLYTWYIFMSIGWESKDCHQHFDESHSAICKDYETWAEDQASSAHWWTSPVGRYNLGFSIL